MRGQRQLPLFFLGEHNAYLTDLPHLRRWCSRVGPGDGGVIMPKFDHRFDSQIQKKEDLRFFRQDDAEDFAYSQCTHYGDAQNVVPADDTPGAYRVIVCQDRLPQAVYFVNEVF